MTGKPAAGILTTGLLTTGLMATGLLAFAGADPAPKGNDPTPTTEERKVPRKTTATAKPGDEIAMELLPAPMSPLVTFRIQFRTGSIDDPEDLCGLSTLTALTLGEGGSKALTHRQVVDRLYPMAGSITVQPEREVVTFIGRVHRDHALRFYGLLSGLLLSPRFDEADFHRNRDDLIASIETGLRGNDDEELGKEALNGFLYLGHPYGHLVAGTIQGLRTITLENVKRHYARQYTRQRVVFGLAGGYSADLLAAIREDFARLPSAGAARRPPLPAPPAIDGVEVLLIEKATPTAAISIGAPLSVTRAERDYYALMVANSWLGEHRTFNGRLMNVMRAARGLNYGDYSYVEWFIQDGGSTFPVANIPRRQQTFSIWIRPVARVNAAFAVRQAVRELRRLVETGMTKEDFESTRAFLLNYSRLWTQSLDRRLGYLLDARFYGGAALVDRVQEELPRLTVADVNTALKERIDPARLRVAIVAEGTRDLARQLTSNGPTPIVYQTPTTDAALLAEDKEIEVYPLGIGPAGIRFYPATTMFEE